MASLTTRLKLRKPASTDVVNVDTDISAPYDAIDAAIGYAVVTSGTRPATPYTGQTIFETDTGKTYMWNGTLWLPQYSDYTPPSNQYSHRNALHNGDMRIAQRGVTGVSGTGSANTGRSGPDRWNVWRGSNVAGCTWTVNVRNSGIPGYPMTNFLRVQRDSGNALTNIFLVNQPLETADSIRFAGKIATVSFWARCGANYSASGSTLNVAVVSGTGVEENSQAVTFTGTLNEISQNPVLTTSWQKFTFTTAAAMQAGLQELRTQFIFTPVGTAGAADYFDIALIQLEEGPVATPFEFKPYQVELSLCQRHYFRTLIGTNSPIGSGFVISAGTIYGTVLFPVPMRIAPAQGASGGNAVAAHNGGATTPSTSIGNVVLNNMIAWMAYTISTAWPVGSGVIIYSGSGTGFLEFFAEI